MGGSIQIYFKVLFLTVLIFSFGCTPKATGTFLTEEELAKEAELLTLAGKALDVGDLEMAKSYIDQAMEINNRSAFTYYVLARISIKNGDKEKALSYYGDYLKYLPTDDPGEKVEFKNFCYDLLLDYYENEQYEKFVDLYETYDDILKEERPDIDYRLANSYYELYEFEKAAINFNRIIKKSSLDAGAIIGYAWSNYHLDNLEIAEEYFIKSIELEPEMQDARYEGLAWTYYLLGEYENAKEWFPKAIEIDKDCYSYNGLGRTEFKMGNVETAKGHLKKSLEIDPECKIPEEMQYLVS